MVIKVNISYKESVYRKPQQISAYSRVKMLKKLYFFIIRKISEAAEAAIIRYKPTERIPESPKTMSSKAIRQTLKKWECSIL